MVFTDDDALAEELRSLRNLAFGTPRFLHRQAGFNFRMTGYQAAMGLAQMQKIDRFVETKRRVARTYDALLADVPGIRTPPEEAWAKNVYWMYAVQVTPELGITRDELMASLGEQGIGSRTMFCPMNLQPFLREQPGARPVDCPVAEELWETGLYLPSSTHLTEDEIGRVVSAIRTAAGR